MIFLTSTAARIGASGLLFGGLTCRDWKQKCFSATPPPRPQEPRETSQISIGSNVVPVHEELTDAVQPSDSRRSSAETAATASFPRSPKDSEFRQ